MMPSGPLIQPRSPSSVPIPAARTNAAISQLAGPTIASQGKAPSHVSDHLIAWFSIRDSLSLG